jgi:predicted Mrr-cat superfamily restriction endonuclease
LSLSEHEVSWLNGVVDGLFRVFRLLGYSELSERIDVTDAPLDVPDVWLVRAGTGGSLAESFRVDNEIRVGFHDTYSGDLTGVSVDALRAKGGSANAIGQLMRFRDGINVEDYVLTPLPGSASYLVGRVSGNYRYDPAVDDFRHARDVTWLGTMQADVLTDDLRRSLRSILTLFHPADQSQLREAIKRL